MSNAWVIVHIALDGHMSCISVPDCIVAPDKQDCFVIKIDKAAS